MLRPSTPRSAKGSFVSAERTVSGRGMIGELSRGIDDGLAIFMRPIVRPQRCFDQRICYPSTTSVHQLLQTDTMTCRHHVADSMRLASRESALQQLCPKKQGGRWLHDAMLRKGKALAGRWRTKRTERTERTKFPKVRRRIWRRTKRTNANPFLRRVRKVRVLIPVRTAIRAAPRQ
jgi:hypothetical protein